MFGEEEAGAPHSNKDSALIIAYEATSTGLLTDMVTYLGMLEFESRKDLVGAAAQRPRLLAIDGSGSAARLPVCCRQQAALMNPCKPRACSWRRCNRQQSLHVGTGRNLPHAAAHCTLDSRPPPAR